MANKYLKHRFTVRETILLCVLLAVLLLGLYFGLVYYPIQSRTAKLDEDLESVAAQRVVEERRYAEYKRMKDELARIEEEGDDTIMPQYDNDRQLNVLTDKFNEYLADVLVTQDFRSSVSENSETGVITRTMTINFSVNEEHKDPGGTVYEKALSVLTKLMTTGYRCSLKSLTLNPASADLKADDCTSVAVTVVIEFFELA